MSLSNNSPETHLATYGSLSPGESNHDQLAGLNGHWSRGTVRGKRIEAGWGATLGFPALILDPSGPLVDVHLFESSDLPDHWQRLDEFEGPGYRRVVTLVSTPEGACSAHIYVLAV
ncbi:MAG: gamma-glutamylcyclotransferase [Acidobacteria bacterium]|nr:gamma-glutamylcyclotransferase [Acidobacteriota bacterium]